METRSFAEKIFRHMKGMRSVSGWWAIFSIPFVVFTLWGQVEKGFYRQGLQLGSKKAAEIIYQDIIAKAKNRECKTIFVEQAGRRVDLINVQCLHLIKDKSKAKGSLADSNKKKTEKKVN